MKKIIDILGIVLPVLLLLMPIFRILLSGKKKPGTDPVSPTAPKMLSYFRTLFIVVLLLAGIIRYLFFSGSGSNGSGSADKPLTVSKHSVAFNESLQHVLDVYYNMSDAFAGSDTAAINKYGIALKAALDSFKVDELKKDSII
jgi:hypothetical protein